LLRLSKFINIIITFFALFSLFYVLSYWIIHALRLTYISQINLQVFCILLSLAVTFIVLLFLFSDLEYDLENKISLKKRTENKYLFWIKMLLVFLPLAIGLFWLTNIHEKQSYLFSVFQKWRDLQLVDAILIVIIYCYLLYIPAYVIDRIFLRNLFTTSEKIVFYPVLSMLLFGFLGFLLPSIVEVEIVKLVIPFLLSIPSLPLLRKRNMEKSTYIRLNLAEVIGLILVILFRIFIYNSALGEGTFLKQDMVYQAGYVARINRYGLAGYLCAPLTERYPVFYFSAWSSITKLLPFPYCNILVMVSFFNHIFATLSFYLLAKKLFNSIKESLFATFALTILSGFSWLYVLTNPPADHLSSLEIYNYIRMIHDKFGMYSGSTVSTIYADCHALVRLWSLGVSFVFLSALLSLNLNTKNTRGYLAILLACLLQITLGHAPELLLIGAASFALIVLTKYEVLKGLLKTTLLSTLISLPFMYIFSYPEETILVTALFVISVSSTLLFRKLITFYKRINKKNFNLLLGIMTLALMWYYGLSIIAFVNSYNIVNIRYPIFTLWYSPPIQWGFIGLLFLTALVKSVVLERKIDNALAFALLTCTLIGTVVTVVNCLNLYHYVGLVYPIMPVYFFPFFALSSGCILRTKKNRIISMRKLLTISLIITMFVMGSLCHIISSSYWRGNGWWREKPSCASLSDEEIQVLNILYATPPKASYEETCFITKDNPYPNLEGTAYQSVRYRTNKENYIIRLSGFVPSPRLVESGLYGAESYDEVLFLINNFSPTRCILVSRDTNSSLVGLLGKPLFKGKNYEVYELPIYLTRPSEGLLVDKIEFNGTVITSERILETNRGEITALNKSRILISLEDGKNFTLSTSELSFRGVITLINVRGTRLYFPEALNVARRIIFYGNLTMKVLNSFGNGHIYLTSLTYNASYKIDPEPWHMTPRTATDAIHTYIRMNNIPFTDTLANTFSILWTLVIILAMITFLVKRQH